MTRRAVDTICPNCWAYTLSGDDNDTVAFSVNVDDVPLTRTGELQAVIGGRSVYDLGHGRLLYRRDRWAISGPSRYPVLTDHRCDHPIPAHWRAPAPAKPKPKEVSF